MTTPSPADGLVTDAEVNAYVAAVSLHLGTLTPKQWEVERFNPAESIARVARIGLEAAAKARTDATALRLREGCESSARKWSVVRQFASGDDFDRWEDMARGSHTPSDAGNEYADDRADDLARILENER